LIELAQIDGKHKTEVMDALWWAFTSSTDLVTLQRVVDISRKINAELGLLLEVELVDLADADKLTSEVNELVKDLGDDDIITRHRAFHSLTQIGCYLAFECRNDSAKSKCDQRFNEFLDLLNKAVTSNPDLEVEQMAKSVISYIRKRIFPDQGLMVKWTADGRIAVTIKGGLPDGSCTILYSTSNTGCSFKGVKLKVGEGNRLYKKKIKLNAEGKPTEKPILAVPDTTKTYYFQMIMGPNENYDDFEVSNMASIMPLPTPTPTPTPTPIPTATPTATPSPASVSLEIELNIDRMGMDYRNFDLPEANPELCWDACLEDPDCAACTYVKPGVQGPNARCWLKHGVPEPVTNDCCISGVRANEP
jgi:hypothetical protein